jgi:hypothetical protein
LLFWMACSSADLAAVRSSTRTYVKLRGRKAAHARVTYVTHVRTWDMMMACSSADFQSAGSGALLHTHLQTGSTV